MNGSQRACGCSCVQDKALPKDARTAPRATFSSTADSAAPWIHAQRCSSDTKQTMLSRTAARTSTISSSHTSRVFVGSLSL
eukprot:583030-Rhodomonas_salina.1